MSKNILVHNPYTSHGNMGDELFKDAFWHLFPNHSFTYTDTLDKAAKTDALIIGGGSFLEFPIPGLDGNEFEPEIPIFYLGVGAETNVHPDHQRLMKRAKLIALRSTQKLEQLKLINSNTIVIPDLVYALYDSQHANPKTPLSSKRVLILPNINVIPKHFDVAWKHIHWQTFKFAFSQMLDVLVQDGYSIQYLPMCNNRDRQDDSLMVEIKSMMIKGHCISSVYRYSAPAIKDIIRLFSSYDTIISQRFHGNVIAEMSHTPYLSIAHHDKLKDTPFNLGVFASYYASSKDTLLADFNLAQSKTISKLPITSHTFEALKKEVNQHLET